MISSCYDRARVGDPAALEAVVEMLRPRLERMAGYYARCSGEDADDLLQEAWVGLLEALPALDMSIGSAQHYLLQRARWRLLDAIKRARVRRCEQLDPVSTDRLSDTKPSGIPGDTSLWEFAGRLKSTQRQVLDCLLRGLTWREAGSALGCTSANIAYHVRQIRREFEAWSGERLPVQGSQALAG